MTDAFVKLSNQVLGELAQDLAVGNISFPPTATELYRRCSDFQTREALVKVMAEMASRGMDAGAVVFLLETIRTEREAQAARAPKIQPVLTTLDHDGNSRRTQQVISDLYRSARYRIWLSTFNIDEGKKGEGVIGELAERFDETPELDVRIYLNIKGERNLDPEEAVRIFTRRFRQKVWKRKRLPAVYYDPRALVMGGRTRSCLHAKCVIVDEAQLFITSANFSEAAQERNLEAGVLIADSAATRNMAGYFQTLVDCGDLKPLVFDGD